MDKIEIEGKRKAAQINNALGFFILVFGFVVMVGMWFTETFVQQMTDLVAGLVLAVIGGSMMLIAKRTLKKLE